MTRTLKSKKQIIEKNGVVELLKIERDGCREVWAIGYPHKVGNQESSLRTTHQFMAEDEARRAYRRYVDFFNGR